MFSDYIMLHSKSVLRRERGKVSFIWIFLVDFHVELFIIYNKFITKILKIESR